MITIPDISHHNPVKDWNALTEKTFFLISKATEGISYVDPMLSSFIKNCEKHNTPYWLYAYLRKGDELAQAKFLVKTCEGKIGPLFVGYILDIEAGNDASSCQKALDYLVKQGCKTMLYTGNADYAKYKNLIAGRPSSCAHWEARYGPNDGTYHESFPCNPSADLHQFTDQGSFPGLSGKTDLSRPTGKKQLGWFFTPSIQTSRTGTVMTSLYIRKGPGVDYDAIGSYRAGAKISILDTVINSNEKPWHKVFHNGQTGYVSGKYVKE